MTASVQSYDVHGLRLKVESEAASLLSTADEVLGPFASGSVAEAHLLVYIDYGPVPSVHQAPAGLKRVWRQRLANDIEVICYAGQDVQHANLLGLAQIRVDLRRRQAQITVGPGAEWCLPRGCVVPVLSKVLASAGQHPVHAACLEVQHDGQRRAVLLAGDRGFGKTTTSLALAKAGMKLMAEDTCFVTRRRRQPGELAVWGLPLACKVHERTFELLAWLRDFPRRPALTKDEYLVEVSRDLYADEKTEIPPQAIFLLDRRIRGDHQITPVDKVEALSMLVRQNVRSSSPLSHGCAGRHFDMLANLVGSRPSYLLSVGPKLNSLRDKVLSALAW